MKDNKDNNEYKNKAIESLIALVANNDREYSIQKDYQCTYDYNGTTYVNTFDVVELSQNGNVEVVYMPPHSQPIPRLNHNNKIEAVYMVCPFQDYWNRYSIIVTGLDLMKRHTKAKWAYLAFLDSGGNLHCLPLKDLNRDKKPRIPFQEIVHDQYDIGDIRSSRTIDYGNPFAQFVTVLYNWCGGQYWGNSKLFFRGQPDVKNKPVPSIYRNIQSIDNEDTIYNEAIQRNPSEFSPNMTAFDNLVKMQHYELPTRLLDITTNPLVALYFACQEAKNDDGVEADGNVLIYLMSKEQIKYHDSDVVCLLSNLARRPKHFKYEKGTKQCTYLVEDIRKDRPTYNDDVLWESAVHEVFCVLPKPNNDRIIKQEGAFFIFGMGGTKEKPAELKETPSEIIIKAAAKPMILKALNLLGINEASLFPETDKVMHQIKKEYCKRQDK